MFECIPGPGHPNEPKRPHMAAQHIAHDIVAQCGGAVKLANFPLAMMMMQKTAPIEEVEEV